MTDEEEIFLKVSKKKNVNLILFNLAEDIDKDEIENKAKKCSLIFNNTASYYAIELVKTLEEMGKKVIDSSERYYYTEDKWIFFLKCREHGIPVPETILLSDNLFSAKDELRKFGHWPVVLKRITGEQGEFVKRADNTPQARGFILIVLFLMFIKYIFFYISNCLANRK